MKSLLMVVVLACSSALFAAESKNTVSITDVLDALKDGPLTFDLALSNEGMRDTEDRNRIKGIDTILEALLSYNHDENNDFRIYTYSGITFNSNTHEKPWFRFH